MTNHLYIPSNSVFSAPLIVKCHSNRLSSSGAAMMLLDGFFFMSFSSCIILFIAGVAADMMEVQSKKRTDCLLVMESENC